MGAGIAGVATAFFTLRATTGRVILIERDRVARGATGRNAGQLTTYFERPLFEIADEFGAEMAIEGQRAFDDAHRLLDLMTAETGASVRVDRFSGHMGMLSLNHLQLYLRNSGSPPRGLREEPRRRRRRIPRPDPDEFASFYTVVPQATIRLDTDDDRYRAVLSDRKGCINSGLLVQQVLAFLERRYPDRFRYVDRTVVDHVVAGAGRGVALRANGHAVAASRVVLCTNGFVDHTIEDPDGHPIELHEDQRVTGKVGYMVAFAEEQPRTEAAMSYIRNCHRRRHAVRTSPGGPTAAGGTVTLTCMGGPEHAIDGPWHASQPFPGVMLSTMDTTVRPFAQATRPARLPYDFQWHGLMGYMDGGVRVIGEHPRHSGLLYNLGCNGVGFLPSICGGERVARILAGETLPPSIFDPR